jgi:DNA topoisomerase-1
MSTGVHCPQDGCAGSLVERKTKRGKIFYGCSAYPTCSFATWDKPIDQKCTQCGFSMLIYKETKRDGAQLKCPSCKAEYPVPGQTAADGVIAE